jgi:hypothetical protein
VIKSVEQNSFNTFFTAFLINAISGNVSFFIK